jgi:aldose 1-epimerase
LEASAQHAQLAYAHAPDESWPFAFEAEQTFRLSANALELTLSLCNRSDSVVPIGLGWHPYFVKRPDSHLSFDASGRWEMGADKLPTHWADSPGLDTHCTVLDVDHCYDGWPGVVHLRDELLHTRMTSSLDRLVVFTNDSRHFVAIEPVSHANNAFNLMNAPGASAAGLGVRQLQPGESTQATMRIHVQRSTALVPPTQVD